MSQLLKRVSILALLIFSSSTMAVQYYQIVDQGEQYSNFFKHEDLDNWIHKETGSLYGVVDEKLEKLIRTYNNNIAYRFGDGDVGVLLRGVKSKSIGDLLIISVEGNLGLIRKKGAIKVSRKEFDKFRSNLPKSDYPVFGFKPGVTSINDAIEMLKGAGLKHELQTHPMNKTLQRILVTEFKGAPIIRGKAPTISQLSFINDELGSVVFRWRSGKPKNSADKELDETFNLIRKGLKAKYKRSDALDHTDERTKYRFWVSNDRYIILTYWYKQNEVTLGYFSYAYFLKAERIERKIKQEEAIAKAKSKREKELKKIKDVSSQL